MTRPILLLTRPERAARDFVRGLPSDIAEAVDVVVSPLQEIVSVEPDRDLAAYDVAVFTSVNAVPSRAPGPGFPAYCVGAQTFEAARQSEFAAVHADGDANALVELLATNARGQRCLHLRGRHTTGDVAKRATEAGIVTAETIVYDQVARTLSDEAFAVLKGTTPVFVPLFSPRSAKLFTTSCPPAAQPYLLFLSSAVAATALAAPAKARHTAAEPTRNELIAVLRKVMQESGTLERTERGV